MMEKDYEAIAERFWNQPWKGEEEARREALFLDDIVQKAHLDRAIEACLPGVRTVFDGGAGTGRFSIPLARRGLHVTHFDISTPMLDKARQRAAREGVSDQIEFVQGRLTELGRYADNQFDLVLSFDAPVSYTWPRHGEVLRELARIARYAVIVSVSSRLGSLPYAFNPTQKLQFLADEKSDDGLVRWYVEHAQASLEVWRPDFTAARRQFDTGLTDDPGQIRAAWEQGQAPWPVTYLFMPEELKSILGPAGLHDIRLAGPGAFARTLPNAILKKLLLDDAHREAFLDYCYQFDTQPSVCGLGKDNLVAVGKKSFCGLHSLTRVEPLRPSPSGADDVNPIGDDGAQAGQRQQA